MGAQLDGCRQICEVTPDVLLKLTDEKSPEGIVAVAKKLPPRSEPPTADFSALFPLVDTRPRQRRHNHTFSPRPRGRPRLPERRLRRRVFAENPARDYGYAVLAAFEIVGDELALIDRLRLSGCTVYATALGRDAMRLGEFSLPRSTCFVVGNEGHGLSEELISACDGNRYTYSGGGLRVA